MATPAADYGTTVLEVAGRRVNVQDALAGGCLPPDLPADAEVDVAAAALDAVFHHRLDVAVALDVVALTLRSGVCGTVWRKDELAYKCRTCERDPTCAICVACFRAGDHSGHDYSIIRTGGGCCDCGDGQAWRISGFCSRHGGASGEADDPAGAAPPALRARIGAVASVVGDAAVAAVAEVVAATAAVATLTDAAAAASVAASVASAATVAGGRGRGRGRTGGEGVAPALRAGAPADGRAATAGRGDAAGGNVDGAHPQRPPPPSPAARADARRRLRGVRRRLATAEAMAVALLGWLRALVDTGDGVRRLVGVQLAAPGPVGSDRRRGPLGVPYTRGSGVPPHLAKAGPSWLGRMLAMDGGTSLTLGVAAQVHALYYQLITDLVFKRAFLTHFVAHYERRVPARRDAHADALLAPMSDSEDGDEEEAVAGAGSVPDPQGRAAPAAVGDGNDGGADGAAMLLDSAAGERADTDMAGDSDEDVDEEDASEDIGDSSTTRSSLGDWTIDVIDETEWSGEVIWRVMYDLRYVLTHVEVSAAVVHGRGALFRSLIALLGKFQSMNAVVRRLGMHVERDSDAWVPAFSMELDVSLLVDLLAAGFTAKPVEPPTSGDDPEAAAAALDVNPAEALAIGEAVACALSLLAQVRAGMWVRNGRAVQGSAVLYRSVFCADWFVDLDVFLLQLVAAVSGGEAFEKLLRRAFEIDGPPAAVKEVETPPRSAGSAAMVGSPCRGAGGSATPSDPSRGGAPPAGVAAAPPTAGAVAAAPPRVDGPPGTVAAPPPLGRGDPAERPAGGVPAAPATGTLPNLAALSSEVRSFVLSTLTDDVSERVREAAEFELQRLMLTRRLEAQLAELNRRRETLMATLWAARRADFEANTRELSDLQARLAELLTLLEPPFGPPAPNPAEGLIVAISPEPTAPIAGEYTTSVLSDYLALLAQVVGERARAGFPASDLLKRKVLTRLAVADQTHSQLLRACPRRLLHARPPSRASHATAAAASGADPDGSDGAGSASPPEGRGWEEEPAGGGPELVLAALRSVAAFTQPREMEQGRYRLIPSAWSLFDPFTPHLTARERTAAEQRRAAVRMRSRQPPSLIPDEVVADRPVLPPLAPLVASDGAAAGAGGGSSDAEEVAARTARRSAMKLRQAEAMKRMRAQQEQFAASIGRYAAALRASAAVDAPYEGRDVADLTAGEYLCPVCRRLANTLLPVVPRGAVGGGRAPLLSTTTWELAPDTAATDAAASGAGWGDAPTATAAVADAEQAAAPLTVFVARARRLAAAPMPLQRRQRPPVPAGALTAAAAAAAAAAAGRPAAFRFPGSPPAGGGGGRGGGGRGGGRGGAAAVFGAGPFRRALVMPGVAAGALGGGGGGGGVRGLALLAGGPPAAAAAARHPTVAATAAHATAAAAAAGAAAEAAGAATGGAATATVAGAAAAVATVRRGRSADEGGVGGASGFSAASDASAAAVAAAAASVDAATAPLRVLLRALGTTVAAEEVAARAEGGQSRSTPTVVRCLVGASRAVAAGGAGGVLRAAGLRSLLGALTGTPPIVPPPGGAGAEGEGGVVAAVVATVASGMSSLAADADPFAVLTYLLALWPSSPTAWGGAAAASERGMAAAAGNDPAADDGLSFPAAEAGALPRRVGLIPLPRLFQTLLEAHDGRPCSACGRPPRSPGGALCLLCGALVCAAGPCGGRAHVRACGAGVGVLLVLKLTAVIVLRGDRRALWGSPYLDEYGEEDADLRRGKPLYLSPHRVAALERLWLRHGWDGDSRLLAATLLARSGQLLDVA
ncbi:hypothetical protein I4F81_007372 [Pyropia yezoensis]|uniref:Uncharacterized protein n=1 Tax=Pyropia yezoensis TaxID=2788 RepID=A0ACC3C4F2_PYRYE|nr:hypothetical protein I4F81_007372 [Neopyropia yezoensis]